MLTRRVVFPILGGLIAAPSIVKANMLMPIRGVKLVLGEHIKPFLINDEQFREMVDDRIVEIAKQVLDDVYGPVYRMNHNLLWRMVNHAQYCSDVPSTKEAMLALIAEEVSQPDPPRPRMSLEEYEAECRRIRKLNSPTVTVWHHETGAYRDSRYEIPNNPVAVTGNTHKV